jgi:hypothetical protein
LEIGPTPSDSRVQSWPTATVRTSSLEAQLALQRCFWRSSGNEDPLGLKLSGDVPFLFNVLKIVLAVDPTQSHLRPLTDEDPLRKAFK